MSNEPETGSDVAPAEASRGPFAEELQGIPKDVLQWLRGQTTSEPECLDVMMDHAASKINVVLAMIVVNRLSSIDRMLRAMNLLEGEVLDPIRLSQMEDHKKVSLLKSLDKNLSEFLDFARKFVAQNQDMFERRHPADDLALLLRSVDPIILRKMVDMLKAKGASLTEDDIGVALKTPSNPLLAELVK